MLLAIVDVFQFHIWLVFEFDAIIPKPDIERNFWRRIKMSAIIPVSKRSSVTYFTVLQRVFNAIFLNHCLFKLLAVIEVSIPIFFMFGLLGLFMVAKISVSVFFQLRLSAFFLCRFKLEIRDDPFSIFLPHRFLICAKTFPAFHVIVDTVASDEALSSPFFYFI